MVALLWDQTGERFYETGVDRGVLYTPNNGVYDTGVAWNGLTAVTESPSGAEATALYADNIKYLSLQSAEEFGGTIEAFTFPAAWSQHDGAAVPVAGVTVGQQTRKVFGLSYRTLLGNDVAGNDLGYKLHLVYGALAAPSEKPYTTVNDSPEAVTMSWTFTTTPVAVSGLKPSAILTIDSTKVSAAAMTNLQNALWGTAGTDPRLPLPDEVISIITAGAGTMATPTNPTATTAGVITIPTVTGVTYRRADTNAVVTSTVTISTLNAWLTILAYPNATYFLNPQADRSWSFQKTT